MKRAGIAGAVALLVWSLSTEAAAQAAPSDPRLWGDFCLSQGYEPWGGAMYYPDAHGNSGLYCYNASWQEVLIAGASVNDTYWGPVKWTNSSGGNEAYYNSLQEALTARGGSTVWVDEGAPAFGQMQGGQGGRIYPNDAGSQYSSDCAGYAQWWDDEGFPPGSVSWFTWDASPVFPAALPIEPVFQSVQLSCAAENQGGIGVCFAPELGDGEGGLPKMRLCNGLFVPSGQNWAGYDQGHNVDWFLNASDAQTEGGWNPNPGPCDFPEENCTEPSLLPNTGFQAPPYLDRGYQAVVKLSEGTMANVSDVDWESKYRRGWPEPSETIVAGGSAIDAAEAVFLPMRPGAGNHNQACVNGRQLQAPSLHGTLRYGQARPGSGGNDWWLENHDANLSNANMDAGDGQTFWPSMGQFHDGSQLYLNTRRFEPAGTACSFGQEVDEATVYVICPAPPATLSYDWYYTVGSTTHWVRNNSFDYYPNCYGARTPGEPGGGTGPGADFNDLLTALDEVRATVHQRGVDTVDAVGAIGQSIVSAVDGVTGALGELEVGLGEVDWEGDAPALGPGPSGSGEWQGIYGSPTWTGQETREPERSFATIVQEELDASGLLEEGNSWMALLAFELEGQASYPVWEVDLAGLGLGMGPVDLSIPDWLWDLLGWVNILTAFIIGRRLVFGG